MKWPNVIKKVNALEIIKLALLFYIFQASQIAVQKDSRISKRGMFKYFQKKITFEKVSFVFFDDFFRFFVVF